MRPPIQNSIAKEHAVLAALAIENGALLASTDHGFSRFRKLRWINPLSDRN